LWENPDVGFAGGTFHCLPSVFANGGSGLMGNSGPKTANVCDKHAKETTRNAATQFTGLLSSFFSENRGAKFLKITSVRFEKIQRRFVGEQSVQRTARGGAKN
jgi:hypothetical protein